MQQWAADWGISPTAIADLARRFVPKEIRPSGGSEAAAQVDVRLEASRLGKRLFRNNVGAYDARFPPSPGTRWGLANETKAMNERLKSSDLIGIEPVLILQSHVGQVIGRFVAREIKVPGWTYNPNDDHQAGQLRFMQLISGYGGNACFATGEGTL